MILKGRVQEELVKKTKGPKSAAENNSLSAIKVSQGTKEVKTNGIATTTIAKVEVTSEMNTSADVSFHKRLDARDTLESVRTT